LRHRSAVTFGLDQRLRHRLDRFEAGAAGQVVVGLLALREVGEFRIGQDQFLGQRDRLSADLIRDLADRRFDRHA
jgi:hypothetical protein